MNTAEVRAELNAIHDRVMEATGECHWSTLSAEFNDLFPDARYEMGADWFDEMLRNKAIDVMRDLDRRGNSQMTLPGIGIECDSTVTVPDGEGSFIRRRLDKATAADLIADEAIHSANVDSAIAARERARQRNKVLLPPMQEHGFCTAGEAIEYLSGGH